MFFLCVLNVNGVVKMIDVMVTAYLECALWTELDESDELLRDNFTIDDFSQETKDKAKED